MACKVNRGTQTQGKGTIKQYNRGGVGIRRRRRHSMIQCTEQYIEGSSRKGNEEHFDRSVVLYLSLFLSLHIESALPDISFYLFTAACALKGKGEKDKLRSEWSHSHPVHGSSVFIYCTASGRNASWRKDALSGSISI